MGDERDNNGTQPINEYVSTVIETGSNTHLLIYYYSSNGNRDFMDIKSTFRICKLENADVKLNNHAD